MNNNIIICNILFWHYKFNIFTYNFTHLKLYKTLQKIYRIQVLRQSLKDTVTIWTAEASSPDNF